MYQKLQNLDQKIDALPFILAHWTLSTALSLLTPSVIKVGLGIPIGLPILEEYYHTGRVQAYDSATKAWNFIWNRGTQTVESVGLKWSKNPIFKYVNPIPRKVENTGNKEINVKFTDVNSWYDMKSEKHVEGAELVKVCVLESESDNRFGEWSGMTFDDDDNIVMVSDRGAVLKAKAHFDTALNKHEVLTGLEEAKISSIDISRNEKDIEEAVYYNGKFIVSHESANKISSYDQDFKVRDELKVSEGIKSLKYNEGIEAMSVLKSGLGDKLIAISENPKIAGDLHSIFVMDPQKGADNRTDKEAFYKSSKGYGVSGMTFLKNGSALVLERKHISKYGVAEDYFIKVKLVSYADIELAVQSAHSSTPVQIEGHEIISIDETKTHNLYSLADNFESIAVKEYGDHISIFMLSDDNRATFQNTLLLQYDINNDVIEHLSNQCVAVESTH